MGKGKKGGRARKEKAEKMTFTQGFLVYQIYKRERDIEEAKFALKTAEEKTARVRKRVEHLRDEQYALIINLLREAGELYGPVTADRLSVDCDPMSMVDSQHVTASLMAMWRVGEKEEVVVAELASQIAELNSQIGQLKSDCDKWVAYRDEGSKIHQTQIQALKDELQASHDSFKTMCDYQKMAYEQFLARIKAVTDDTVANAKYEASQDAVQHMDKYDKGEVMDREFLRKEVDLHEQRCGKLAVEVDALEQRNLDIMKELFECSAAELKLSRSLAVTKSPTNQLDSNDESVSVLKPVLEIDLSPIDRLKNRPSSAVIRALQRKSAEIDEKIEDTVKADTEEIKAETEWELDEREKQLENDEEQKQEEEREEKTDKDQQQDKDEDKKSEDNDDDDDDNDEEEDLEPIYTAARRSSERRRSSVETLSWYQLINGVADDPLTEELAHSTTRDGLTAGGRRKRLTVAPEGLFDISEEEMQLATVELGLLKLAGRPVGVHTVEKPSAAEIRAEQWNPKEYPVSKKDIRRTLLQSQLAASSGKQNTLFKIEETT